MESKAARQYISSVRKRMTCSAASRKQLLFQGQELVARFEQENPDARYADFVTAFGPPEDFAGEMLSMVDSKEIEAAQRRRRSVRRAALAVLALALIAAVAFWFAKWSKVQEAIRENYIIVKGAQEQITEEEYYEGLKEASIMILEEGR